MQLQSQGDVAWLCAQLSPSWFKDFWLFKVIIATLVFEGQIRPLAHQLTAVPFA